jgi:hypothetical protein
MKHWIQTPVLEKVYILYYQVEEEHVKKLGKSKEETSQANVVSLNPREYISGSAFQL